MRADRCQSCFHQEPFCTCPPEDQRLIEAALSGPSEMLERIRQIEAGMVELDAAAFEADIEEDDGRAALLLEEFTLRMGQLNIHPGCRINSWETYWCPVHRRMEERFWCEECRFYHGLERPR